MKHPLRMGATPWSRARRVAEAALVAASAWYLLAYLGVALQRLGYPFELEWMEGGMVDHVRRILAGQPIYARPTLEFVSFLYPPLYYAVAAGAAKVLGIGFLPLRLVSFLSSLGVFALGFWLVRRETGSALAGFVAAGLYAATYPRSGGWFDLARLDSFYRLVLLAGIVVLRTSSSALAAGIAGLLFAAAFLTKQSALVVFIPLAIHALLADRRRVVWFSGVAVIAAGTASLLLDRTTDGWFGYYCFQLPARHPRVPGGELGFWTVDLFPVLTVACVAAGAVVVQRLMAGRGRDRWFFPLLAAGMIGSSWSVRSVVGAETNNLFPALAALSILVAVGLDEVRRRATGNASPRWGGITLSAEVLLLVQLALLAYDPRQHLPTAADRAAGERLVRRIAEVPGEVYTPHHGYLARRAGKREYAHALGMDNVFLDDEGALRDALGQEMFEAIESRRFAAVLMESDGRYSDLFLRQYVPRERLFDSPDVFMPVAGNRIRPELLGVRR